MSCLQSRSVDKQMNLQKLNRYIVSHTGLHYINFCNLFISVKYLREVTPYFRKSSVLNDVGWGGGGSGGVTSPEPNNKTSSQHTADRRVIPLKMCYLCRNLAIPDPQRKLLEIHSPDAKNSCILRCPDEHIASQWFNAIHSNIHVLTQIALSEAHSVLSNSPSASTEIKMMGWVAEQVSMNCSIHLFLVNLNVYNLHVYVRLDYEVKLTLFLAEGYIGTSQFCKLFH